MKLHQVAPYLMCFDDVAAEAEAEEPAPDEEERAPEEEAAPTQEEAVPVLESREELTARIQAEAKMEYVAQLKIEREAFAERVAAERGKWVAEEVGALSKQLEQAIQQGMADLCGALENVLRPFVAGQALKRLLDDFLATLQSLAGDHDHPTVKLSGPADLLEAIEAKLRERNISVETSPSDHVEVQASVGATTIATRMQEWLAAIEQGHEVQ